VAARRYLSRVAALNALGVRHGEEPSSVALNGAREAGDEMEG
jgi:hypothetical protein